MDKIYSKRNAPQPDTYRYDVPDRVRWRILNTLNGFSQHGWDGLGGFSVDRMLLEVGEKLLQTKIPVPNW